jgi:hypothetical protein
MFPEDVFAGGKAGNKATNKPKAGGKAEGGIPRFFLHYAVVQDSLKGGHGEWVKLITLSKWDLERETQTATHLVHFWHHRAMRHCDTWLQESIKLHYRTLPEKASESQRKAVMEKVWDDIDPCLESYYYDHWEELNQTIRNQYETATGADRQQRTR